MSVLSDQPPTLPALSLPSSPWFSDITPTASPMPSTPPSRLPTSPNLSPKFDTIQVPKAATRKPMDVFSDKNSLADLQGLSDDTKWIITVVEPRIKSPKKLQQLTVYVTTPTTSLTLLRSYQTVVDFDARLRAQLPSHMPSQALAVSAPPSTPKKRTSGVLASLSRTLSPRRGATLKDPDTLDIGVYLTKISSDKTIRESNAWKSFFKVNTDDLESVRVERRIKRTRSDVGAGRSSTVFPEPQEQTVPTAVQDRKPISDSSVTETPSTLAEPLSAPSEAKENGAPLSPEPKQERRDPSSTTEFTSSSMTDVFDTPSRSHSAEPQPKRSSKVQLTDSVHKISRKRRAPAVTLDSFECMRVLGKGCAGKVLLVKKKDNGALYALKAIHKQHVLAHRELDHTRTEQTVLKRCSRDQSNPFVVKLHYSFHDQDTLYLALDFHPGGDLATQLARWGRLGKDRTRFYCAEIADGLEGLHKAGIIYRDLKPENILISEGGHVVLTDFGLSKDFGHGKEVNGSKPSWMSHSQGPTRSASTPTAENWMLNRRETTTTFCGTAEYLAPEVLLGEAYSYEVDSWSLGTMLYEMLAGVTPFWSEDHSTMYRRVLHEELTFDESSRAFDDDTKNLLRGLLQRDPLLRMTDTRIKRHPYFSMIEWAHVTAKRYVPPFIPTLNPHDPTDTSQFDDAYTSQIPTVAGEDPSEAPGAERDEPEGEPQAAFDEEGRDVFDGYSYFGGRDADSIVGESDEEEAQMEGTGDTSLATETTPSINSDSTASTSVATPDEGTRRPRSSDLKALLEAPADVTGIAAIPIVEDEEDEFDDELDEWDVVEADVDGEDQNGGKGTTLWARGVKDRYRMLLSATPRTASPLRPTNVHRKESLSSQSSRMPSPTQDPKKSLKRLASGRSRRSSGSGQVVHRGSEKSLYESKPSGRRRRTANSSATTSSTGDSTPKKGNHTIKRLASAFLPLPKDR